MNRTTIMILNIDFINLYLLLAIRYNTVDAARSTLRAVSEETLPEDGKLNYTELAKKYGHAAEEYDFVTEDGYILKTFRIPGRKPPVLLFHGLADTADSFVLRGNISLSITLANEGYEVWAGNNRGNKYTRRHVTLNPDKTKFWDYSFHEIGYYDLAATIDFILNKTKQDSVSIIGHSQGTTVQFVLTSLRPEYNAKIKVAIAMAPGVFYEDANSFPLSLVTNLGPVIDALVPQDIQEFQGEHALPSSLLKFICSKGAISYLVCGVGAIASLVGFNPDAIEPEFLGVIAGHFPAGFSRKSVLHYNQLLLKKRFSQFDYGVDRNKIRYGKGKPPDYDLGVVTMPVALLVGRSDNYGRVKDAEHLRSVLQNVVHYEVLKPKQWNHGDFLFSIHMPRYLYPSILKILKEYN